MNKMAYYAYDIKTESGIVETWDECQKKVNGVSGAKYKKFKTRIDAENFLNSIKNGDNNSPVSDQNISNANIDPNAPNIRPEKGLTKIFTDGSYNMAKNTYGYAAYIIFEDGTTKVLYGSDKCTENGRNIEGEVAAAQQALRYVSGKSNNIIIYHDYEGIAKWPNLTWDATKSYTKAYAAYVNVLRNTAKISFYHVKGHSKNEGNEMVDNIAKFACGLMTEKSLIQSYPLLADKL